jgi:hypothetical protein
LEVVQRVVLVGADSSLSCSAIQSNTTSDEVSLLVIMSSTTAATGRLASVNASSRGWFRMCYIAISGHFLDALPQVFVSAVFTSISAQSTVYSGCTSSTVHIRGWGIDLALDTFFISPTSSCGSVSAYITIFVTAPSSLSLSALFTGVMAPTPEHGVFYPCFAAAGNLTMVTWTGETFVVLVPLRLSFASGSYRLEYLCNITDSTLTQ